MRPVASKKWCFCVRHLQLPWKNGETKCYYIQHNSRPTFKDFMMADFPHFLIAIAQDFLECRYNAVQYCTIYYINNYRNWSRMSIRSWIHKIHPIPRPIGRAMRCLLWIFGRKWPCYNGTAKLRCYWHTRYNKNTHELKWHIFMSVYKLKLCHFVENDTNVSNYWQDTNDLKQNCLYVTLLSLYDEDHTVINTITN